MFIFLSKFLPLFVYPLGLACLLLGASLALFRRPRLRRASLAGGLLVLLVGGNHWAALGLARSLEWRYLPPAELPSAPALVVLGGATQSASYPRPGVEVNGAGDRLIYAAWLYKQGKAPRLLLSGGGIDWLSEGSAPAEDMAVLLEGMGVPRQAMWLESASRNTYENAANSRAILSPLGIRRILLVTSALHMPRAVGLFERQGFEVIPAPTDFLVTQAAYGAAQEGRLANALINLLPSAENLALTSRALKEYFGILVYQLRGWL